MNPPIDESRHNDEAGAGCDPEVSRSEVIEPWGRINEGQGYGILVYDLDRAIAVADLNRWPLFVVQQARRSAGGRR